MYIPLKYQRFSYEQHELPSVPDGTEIRFTDTDFGPATKILPALKDFAGQDVAIIFCDDDQRYDPDWASRLMRAAKKKPDCAIVEQGTDLKYISPYNWSGSMRPRAKRLKKDIAYRLRRALTLGTWKPQRNTKSGYVDILEGYGGVLVYPHFFQSDAFQIPDCAWMVDDIWLSGQLELNGVKIWFEKSQSHSTKNGKNAGKSNRKWRWP